MLLNQFSPVNLSQSHKTILFVFAGRQEYMKILIRYLRKELENKTLSEVHLWDMCGKHIENRKYLNTLEGNGVKIMRDKRMLEGPGYKNRWNLAYQYYLENCKDDDILIKCDDDIVYIKNLIHLVNYTKSKEKIGLVYPNIINNDAAAWVQLKKGMINVDPKRCTKIGQKIKDAGWGSSHATAKWAKQGNVLSDWYRRKDCADWAFDEFLANPSSFELDEVYTWDVPQRVSINMFCARGNHFKEIVKWFLSHKTKDDEHFLSFRYHRNNKKQKDIEYAMVLNSVVVHHSFRPQKIDKQESRRFEFLAPLSEAQEVSLQRFERMSLQTRH
tara:strand:+ start:48 stop:1034 length:987 start_codon:yes stop_codon:yes gene_type:complete